MTLRVTAAANRLVSGIGTGIAAILFALPDQAIALWMRALIYSFLTLRFSRHTAS
ncbi:MAG TPA: hypothetical protein VGQ81_16085 [Acidobacteriota bacterium]|jgi:hypothetical protein|nr:hypothetical protein [Acidobacteriota bacterium]